jgi:triacylglycerol lipase
VLVIPSSGDGLAWYDDLDVAFVPHPAGGAIGNGYLARYDALRERIDRTLGTGAQPYVLVGHGIGAALGTVHVMERAARALPLPSLVVSFGSPRVGDAAFVAAYDALAVPTWRVANHRDLAQRIPALDYNYAHVDTLIALDSVGVAKLDHRCTHALSTYLHLLAPERHPLAGDCLPRPEDAAMASYLGGLPP